MFHCALCQQATTFSSRSCSEDPKIPRALCNTSCSVEPPGQRPLCLPLPTLSKAVRLPRSHSVVQIIGHLKLHLLFQEMALSVYMYYRLHGVTVMLLPWPAFEPEMLKTFKPVFTRSRPCINHVKTMSHFFKPFSSFTLIVYFIINLPLLPKSKSV